MVFLVTNSISYKVQYYLIQSMPDTSQKPETISNGTDWVMIIDDEFDIVSTFKQGLERRGFHVFGFTESMLCILWSK